MMSRTAGAAAGVATVIASGSTICDHNYSSQITLSATHLDESARFLFRQSSAAEDLPQATQQLLACSLEVANMVEVQERILRSFQLFQHVDTRSIENTESATNEIATNEIEDSLTHSMSEYELLTKFKQDISDLQAQILTIQRDFNIERANFWKHISDLKKNIENQVRI